MVYVPTNIYIDNQNHSASLIFKPTYKLLMLQNVLYEVNDGMSTARTAIFMVLDGHITFMFMIAALAVLVWHALGLQMLSLPNLFSCAELHIYDNS